MQDRNSIFNHVKKWRDYFLIKKSTYSKLYKKPFNFFIDTFFPIECLLCKTEGRYICAKCAQKIPIKRFQTCPKCHTPSELGRYCQNCRTEKNLNGLLALGDYKDRVTELIIKKYKYGFIKDLSTDLSGILTSFFAQNAIIDGKIFSKYYSHEILIVPVPLHKKRLNWRGFNQSAELAIKFAQNFKFSIDLDNLIKIKHTQAQAKLKGNERLENLKNCFIWQSEKISYKCTILIDDVSTTGSTLNECAQALKNAGAKNIWALVLASG